MPLEAADIQALAQALQTLNTPAQPASVNATSVKLPSFWQGNPEVWFRQVESVFSTRNPAITTQQTKFEYVIQALDNSTADRVQGIILNPPAEPYTSIKAALIKAFGKSQAEKDQELLNLNGLGDRKPSELLQHIQNMNADPKTLIKALFLTQLPPDVRKILATSTKTEIEELASEADRIVEVSRLAQISSIRVETECEQATVSAVTSGRDRQPKKSNSWPIVPGLCKYHSKFGEKAWNCAPPCKLNHLPTQKSENGRAGRQ